MTADQTPILELKNIKKSYNAVQALKDAGLRVYPGEVHALMGGNGAGKSTLIKIIAQTTVSTTNKTAVSINAIKPMTTVMSASHQLSPDH